MVDLSTGFVSDFVLLFFVFFLGSPVAISYVSVNISPKADHSPGVPSSGATGPSMTFLLSFFPFSLTSKLRPSSCIVVDPMSARFLS